MIFAVALLSLLLMLAAGAALFLLAKMQRIALRRLSRSARERKLRRTIRNQARALLSGLDESVLGVDLSGTILSANPAAERMFGSPANNLIGLPLIRATLSATLQNIAEEVFQTGQSTEAEITLQGPRGRILRVKAMPSKGAVGEPVVIILARDLSEIRRLETIRRDFVANVSHELRTPLASIRAMAETLEDGALEDPEVAPKFLASIVKEADRLTRIADDLLVLSDAESGPREVGNLNLSGLLKTIVERYMPQAKKAGLEIAAEIPEGLEVQASGDQMEQVFVNLLDNAVKYTPSGGTITVSAAKQGPQVAISFQDTGIGIMTENLPRIFERFYRVDKGRSRESGGTGLGLSIVKNIVEAHGGSVGVASELNKGSAFTVRLPLDSPREE